MVCCPLCCNNEPFETVNGIDKKDYRYYRVCKLIFSYPKDLPTLEEERNCYLQHRNGIEDKRYVQFLNQAVIPAMDYLQQGMECLDFGCGPVPTLSIMVKRNGLPCDDYDPLFFPELPGKSMMPFLLLNVLSISIIL